MEMTQVDLVAGWILIGAVVMIMLVFYLLHFPDPDIRKSTWTTLSNTCSLFCSISIFKSLDRLVRLACSGLIGERRLLSSAAFLASDAVSVAIGAGGVTGNGVDESARRLAEAVRTDFVSVSIGFVEMIFWFILVEGFLYFSKDRPLQLAAWGLIGAHIVGFSTLDAFYPLQLMEVFSGGMGASLLVVLIAALGLTVLLLLSHRLRRSVTVARMVTKRVSQRISVVSIDFNDVVNTAEVHWLKQCVDSENECCAFALGFLISISVRLSITGNVHQLHWVPADVGDTDGTWLLLAYAVLFGFLTVAMSLFKEKLHHWLHVGHHGSLELRDFQHRVGEVAELTLAMTTGWCLLFWGYWAFWNGTGRQGLIAQGSVMVGRVTMVLVFSIIAFVGLFVADQLADRLATVEEGLRALSEAFVLLLGLCWESAFMQALDSINANYRDRVQIAFIHLGLTVLLNVCVMPAWILYILPFSLFHDPHERDSTRGSERTSHQSFTNENAQLGRSPSMLGEESYPSPWRHARRKSDASEHEASQAATSNAAVDWFHSDASGDANDVCEMRTSVREIRAASFDTGEDTDGVVSVVPQAQPVQKRMSSGSSASQASLVQAAAADGPRRRGPGPVPPPGEASKLCWMGPAASSALGGRGREAQAEDGNPLGSSDRDRDCDVCAVDLG
eukprot:TRINITY_DN23169_c0_g1_i1.p1 TRINITY_DN23169_c0_g1~~TRINITY_DN23169_c0_g1_i1.p1  ORF type:complete len:774 (+),score=166.35 TRINITY_DN23169_c0_g1_i1:306-2324(+)